MSKFADLTEAALTGQIAALGLSIERRVVHPVDVRRDSGERWLEIRLRGMPVTIWIYDDQIDISGPGVDLRLEHWDAATPHEARAAALEALNQAAAAASTDAT